MSYSLVDKVSQAITYAQYRELMHDLLAKNQTTGDDQSESMIHYTRMNEQRMKRWEKTTQLIPELIDVLSNIKTEYTWLVLTEAWCGDAAHGVPILNAMAEKSEKINLRILLRDRHLDLMDDFLTNGGRSIPKLIVIDKNSNTVVDTWGPRPGPVQDMMLAYKKDTQDLPYEEFTKTIQLWYARDKSHTMQNEFLAKIQGWN